MGLFDGAIDSCFGQGDEGQPVFYPWGPVGRGYIVTLDVEKKLRVFVRNYYRLILVGSIFGGTVLTRFGSAGVLSLGVLLLLMLAAYEIRVRQLVRGAARTTSRRGKASSAQRSAGEH